MEWPKEPHRPCRDNVTTPILRAYGRLDPPCDVDDRRYLITEVTDVAGNLLYWEAP